MKSVPMIDDIEWNQKVGKERRVISLKKAKVE